MNSTRNITARSYFIWSVFSAILIVPIVAAALSPQLQWRDAIYILAGFAGVIAMCLLLVQPMMMSGLLPGLYPNSSRRIHKWVGGSLVLAVIIHVGALWITSPPDVIDALVFNSPTPFSVWGVVAMWAVFISAFLAVFRKRLKLKLRTWRIGHITLSTVLVVGTVVHAFLIEGTMETVSKLTLSALILMATALVIFQRMRMLKKPR